MHRLQKYWYERIQYDLVTKYNLRSTELLPKVGRLTAQVHTLDAVLIKDKSQYPSLQVAQMKAFGQRGIRLKAQKAVSDFSQRKGSTIGNKTDMRLRAMFEFIERFATITLPALRSMDPNRAIGMRRDSAGNTALGMPNKRLPTTILNSTEASNAPSFGADVQFFHKSVAKERKPTLLTLRDHIESLAKPLLLPTALEAMEIPINYEPKKKVIKRKSRR
eukprot:Colp12_sorted_trinity150504_noHs@15270